MTSHAPSITRDDLRTDRTGDRHPWVRRALAGMFLAGGVVHVVLGLVAPEVYDSFADGAIVDVVRTAWRDLFVPNATLLALGLAAFEATVGGLILRGGRAGRFGLVGAIAFHVALVAFGWWYLAWSVPMIALLVWFGRGGPGR